MQNHKLFKNANVEIYVRLIMKSQTNFTVLICTIYHVAIQKSTPSSHRKSLFPHPVTDVHNVWEQLPATNIGDEYKTREQDVKGRNPQKRNIKLK
jgi:hypothetical protein